MFKFKVGDTIKVTSGKDQGREGKIERVFPREARILVPGLNLFKKHVKPGLAADKKGGVFEIPRPLDVAKIALVCPHCKKLTRVGFEIKGQEKVRVCRKCKKVISSSSKTVKKGVKK